MQQEQELVVEKAHLNDAGKSLLVNNLLKYFTNMRLRIRSDSDMRFPYQSNEKNPTK